MKNLKISGILFLIVLISACEPQAPKKEMEKTPEAYTKTQNKKPIKHMSSSSTGCNNISNCVVSDKKVFAQTANFWINNFNYKFETEENGNAITHCIFDKDSLAKLQGLKENCTQIRAYYILNQGSQIPQLALVNVNPDSCKDDFNPDSLDILISHESGCRFISSPEITAQLAEWQQHIENLGEFRYVLGYNYQWQTIWKALEPDSLSEDTLDLKIRHAIHSTETDDLKYAVVDSADTNVVGYVTVDLILTALDGPSEGDYGHYDFSLPCPQLCGDLVCDLEE